MLPKKICFVDIETTGMRVNFDRIIEIGVLRVEDNKLVESYQTLINPNAHIPQEILEMTGINSLDLEKAPSFYEIKKDLSSLLDDAVFVAHNVRFDYSFLKNEFKRFEMSFSPKQICTVKLSRSLYPDQRRHNLDALIERHGFECKNRHRAFDDAKILWDFYQLIQKSFPEEKLVEVVNKALKKPSVPLKISQEILDELPQSPGVYIFYGQSNIPIYIGKSINIKTRVLSHFSSDHLSSKEMKISQQIERIEVIKTTGELGALLKESELVKELLPLYNQKLRLKKELVVLKANVDKMGYKKVLIDTTSNIDPTELENILGVFRSKRQAKEFLAKVCKEHNLCEKLLGLENTKDGCFSYRLGRCMGACMAKENVLKYNLRFTESFLNSKIRTWPFNGSILIQEGVQSFLIDRWCCNGNPFDLDTYKILLTYLKSPSNLKKIKKIVPSTPPTISENFIRTKIYDW